MKFQKNLLSFALSFVLLVIFSPVQAQDSGRIIGVLHDETTGEPVIGANVYLENTAIGAATDLDGAFLMKGVPEGTYELVISVVGYAETRVQGVIVKIGDSVKLDVAIKPEILTTETIVVEAEMLKNNEAAMLKMRQQAKAVTDAISAEKISRLQVSDVGEAMKAVTGASVLDDKYVYIRGLGDRYSNTTLNGSQLTTADDNKRSVQVDLFPAKLMENIVAVKSFTPDKPANFTGGMIEMTMKAFPEKLHVDFSASTSFNTETTGISDFLSSGDDSGTDWLGFDDGTRDLPEYIKQNPVPGAPSGFETPEEAEAITRAARAFTTNMIPTTVTAPINQSYSFTLGNRSILFGNELGYNLGITYRQDYTHKDNSFIKYWEYIYSKSGLDDELYDNRGAFYRQSTLETNWTVNAALSYKLNDFNELKTNLFNTQSGKENVSQGQGYNPNYPSWASNWIQYTERNTRSYQLIGKHFIPQLIGSTINWRASIAESSQYDPDLRVFQYVTEDNGNLFTDENELDAPSHFFRDLNEIGYELSMDVSVPFRQWSGLSSTLKFGGAFNHAERTYESTQYSFKWKGDVAPRDYIANGIYFTEGAGVISEASNRFLYGNYLRFKGVSGAAFSGVYSAREVIPAAYMMVELPLRNDLKFIGGVRWEYTDLLVSNGPNLDRDSLITDPYGVIYEVKLSNISSPDFLPSINFIYALIENMNLRFAYSQTLARPSFRELAPVTYKNNLDGYQLGGNPELKKGKNYNWDVRWEWFPRPGELVSLGWFYKDLKNPIQNIITGNYDDPTRTYTNAESGFMWGIELEGRRNLDFVSWLKDFEIGLNYFYIISKLDYDKLTKERLERFDPLKLYSRTFPLEGQSNYTFNVDINYHNDNSGTTVNMHYYVFGDRLVAVVGSVENPDIYEKGRGTLSATISQYLLNGFSVKVYGKNLLNAPVEYIQTLKLRDGGERVYVHDQNKPGVTYGISFAYSFE